MALQTPKASEMFGDATAKELASRNEEYQESLNKALSAPRSVNASGEPVQTAEDTLSALVANKSMTPEALASVQNALASQRAAASSINKEITTTSPLSDSFAAFDLEAPAKLLTPRPTPLRNRIPRKKGVGTSHRIKRILGYTGTGTGGAAGGNIWPGLNQETATSGVVTYGARGPMIQYSADNLVTPYHSYGLSDSVTFDAFFSGVGYQDLRQLSSTSTLYATMLMEERMMLMARNSLSGQGTGFLFGPSIITPSVVGPTFIPSNVTPISNSASFVNPADSSMNVTVGASAGAFGGSNYGPSSGQKQVYTAAGALSFDGEAIFLEFDPIPGAVGYQVFVQDLNNNQVFQLPDASYTQFTYGTQLLKGIWVQGDLTKGTIIGTGPAAVQENTSAYANAYDGIIPILSAGTGGAVNESLAGAAFSTSNPGVEFQNVFAALYNNVKADPDEILLNGSDRRQLSDAIKNGSTANYRINLQQSDVGGYVGGATIDSLYNEITGKMVSLTVHPWLPQGVAPVMSYTLPIPDTEVSDVWSNFLVQDYMGIQWPIQKFTYDFSTYFRGTFQCQAPAWNGIVTNIGA